MNCGTIGNNTKCSGSPFLPLLVSSARDGTLLTGRVTIPLLADYGELFRMLQALPLLVLAAPQSDHLLRAAIRQFSRGGFVHHFQQPGLETVLFTARRLRDSMIPELVCLLIAFLPNSIARA